MAQLSYSFSMALLHSIWQAGLLWLLYILTDRVVFQKTIPLDKRNFLFVILTIQLALFILGFFIYYFNPQFNFNENLISIIARKMFPAEYTFLLTRWLFSAYLLIIGYKFLKAVYTWYSFQQQFKQGLCKPGIYLKLFTESKVHHFGIKRKVKLWLSSNINTPVTFGFFKPVILLPVALLNNITTQQAETLILHELTHIKANDYLLNWLLLITETVFFFNPFVSLLSKKIRLEREKYCDIRVVAFKYSPAVYAETLLIAERIKQGIFGFHLAAVHNKTQLLHRIQFFSSQHNFLQNQRTRIIGPLISLLLVSVLFSAVIFQTRVIISPLPDNKTSLIQVPFTGSLESDKINFRNINIPVINNTELDKMVAAVEKQRPMIEKHIKKLHPLISSVINMAEENIEQAIPEYAQSIAIKENDAGRQIIIKEESSGSKTSTVKVYRLTFANGLWQMIPEWMATAKEIATDSTGKRTDSSTKRIFSLQ